MVAGRSTRSDGPPPHFIVIVPGYMGSRLRDRETGEIVWVDFSSLPHNPLEWEGWLDRLFSRMVYPNENLEPAGIMNEVVFVPPWARQEHYGRLLRALEDMGYQADPEKYPEEAREVYTFAYDWRQDNRISARQLGAAIERWRAHHPGAQAWLIGHSNGGIVSRWYVEKEGGVDTVGRVFLMGSPWDGAPKGMRIMFSGLDTLFRRRFNLFGVPERTRELIRSFPSAYHLIPVQNPFLRDPDNNVVDPFSNTEWLSSDRERELLADGKRFNEALPLEPSVETLCFFGRKKPTQTYGVVNFEAGGRWKEIEWFATEAGDGTVPERSAIHPRAHAKLPFVVGHGDIYINPAVLEFLEWELVGKYRGADRDFVATDRMAIAFEPEKETFAPGETIPLWTTVHEMALGSPPVSGAQVQALLEWRGPLPGTEEEAPSTEPVGTRLWEVDGTAGRYEGALEAPDQEGYYRLRAAVVALGQPPVHLEELVLVEDVPEE